MKKIIYLLLLLTAYEAKAQDGLVFKMKYQPGHKYVSTFGIAMNVKVNMSGNDQIIEKLKSQGITMPVTLIFGVNLNGDVTTGMMDAGSAFPLTANYIVQEVKVNLNGNNIDPLKGKTFAIKMYGHSNPDGKIKADSSVFNGKKDTAKTGMSTMLNALQNQIKFPDRALKVGDTFTQDAPMNLPMAKMGATATKTIMSTIYKLVSISDGKAYFDVTNSADIQLSIKGATVSLTGNGTGKLVYSIKDNFPVSLNHKVIMKLNVTLGTMVVDGTADLTIDSTNTVN